MIYFANTDEELAQAISFCSGGDMIELSGSFGPVLIEGAPYNKVRVGIITIYNGAPVLSGPVTIRSQNPEARATIAQVAVKKSDFWRFDGIDVLPGYQPNTFTAMDLDGYDVRAVDCFITYGDPTGWTAQDWLERAGNGIIVRCDDNLIQRCRMETVSTGFQFVSGAVDGWAEGNTVRGFARDGCRVLVDHVTLENNHISRPVKVDDNHDDLFQSWQEGAVGTGIIRGLTLRKNTFDGRPVAGDPLSTADAHGISCFKTTADGWLIQENTVALGHWNGIVLDQATDCTIRGNKVVIPDPESTRFASIRIRGDASNTVANNIADRLDLSPEIVTAGNVELKPA